MASDMPRLMRLGLEIRKHTASLASLQRSRDVVMLGVDPVMEGRGQSAPRISLVAQKENARTVPGMMRILLASSLRCLLSAV
jgi:hypothetical protein